MYVLCPWWVGSMLLVGTVLTFNCLTCWSLWIAGLCVRLICFIKEGASDGFTHLILLLLHYQSTNMYMYQSTKYGSCGVSSLDACHPGSSWVTGWPPLVISDLAVTAECSKVASPQTHPAQRKYTCAWLCRTTCSAALVSCWSLQGITGRHSHLHFVQCTCTCIPQCKVFVHLSVWSRALPTTSVLWSTSSAVYPHVWLYVAKPCVQWPLYTCTCTCCLHVHVHSSVIDAHAYMYINTCTYQCTRTCTCALWVYNLGVVYSQVMSSCILLIIVAGKLLPKSIQFVPLFSEWRSHSALWSQ